MRKNLTRIASGSACVLVGMFSALWIMSLVSAAYQSSRIFDFAQEWTSARNYLTGLPVYLDYGRSLEIHLGGTASPAFAYNAHPPGAVVLALPFGWLEYRSAYLAWTIFSLLCFLVSFRAMVRTSGRECRSRGAVGLFALVVSGNAFAHQFVQGQLNLVILLLITAAWIADRKNAVATSGALIGLAAACKLFPAFLILYHLARRNWRAIWGAAVAFLAVNALGWFLFQGQAYQDYFLRVAPEVTKFRDALPNASLLGFWSKLFDGRFGEVLPWWYCPPLAQVLAMLSGLVLTSVTFWLMRSRAQRSDDVSARGADEDLAYALCCAGMLLVSPITWDHYFLLLIPGVWIVWQASHGRLGLQMLVVAVAVVLLWLNPYRLWQTFLPAHYAADGQFRAVGPAGVLTWISLQFYALLGFFLLVCRELRQRQNSSQPGGGGDAREEAAAPAGG